MVYGPPRVVLVVKNPPANAGDIRDTGLILGWEDPLKEGMATHSSILAWRILWTKENPVDRQAIVQRSDQISRSVVSNSLRPHESQHARPPCPSPTPGVHGDSRPLSQWCRPAISSSVVPFSSCLQSLPASESLPMSQLFAWGGRSTGVSALPSFLPKKSQGWSPSEWTGWISSIILPNFGELILWRHPLELPSGHQS